MRLVQSAHAAAAWDGRCSLDNPVFDAPLWHNLPACPPPCVSPYNNNPAAFSVLNDDQSGSTRQQLQAAQVAGLSARSCNSLNMPGCGACGLLEDQIVGVCRCVRIHGRGCHDIYQGAMSDPDSLSCLPVVWCMLPHDASLRRYVAYGVWHLSKINHGSISYRLNIVQTDIMHVCM